MSAIYAIYICNHENNVPSALSKQTVDHVPKYMSCHEAIVVITGRAHCFHDCIYIYAMHRTYSILLFHICALISSKNRKKIKL